MIDMDKYRVSLTTEERADLEQLLSSGKAAARKLTHARILLLADDSLGNVRPDDAIVAALGTSRRTVARVRHQLVTEGIDVALLRRPQPPRPDKIKIKGDVEQELIRVTCSDPPQGRCRWTLCLLADELVALGLVATVSHETVRQALKKTTSGRGSSRRGASRPKPTPRTSGGWRT
jgi:DNA-binding transcriptional LysR family regulator